MTFAVALLLALSAAQPADSQSIPAESALSYADLADLALTAPVVAHVRLRSVDRLSEEEAPNVRPGYRRYFVEADVVALIRGAGGLPSRVRYLVDLPNDSDGRPARLRRREEYLLVARRVPNRPDELQLTALDGQIPFAPVTADRLRAILAEALAADAPPEVTGVGRAFHVPGALEGESETQVFLETADNRPISLIVLRRPGERPRWSVALGEIVDDRAAAPRPDSLLWYRLACSLPPILPASSLDEATAEEARAIAADYRLILNGLGRCTRNRG